MTITVEEVFAACDLDAPEAVQIEYSNHVFSSIECAIKNDGGDVMIEAETGVGKTLGYLIPAAIKAVDYDGRVIISTFTKALQRQVMEDAGKMVEGIRRATGRSLRVARLVGRSNFFDPDKVKRFRDGFEREQAPAPVIDAWDDLVEWLDAEDSSGEIQDYIDEAGDLPGGIQPTLVCLDSTSGNEKAVSKYARHAVEAAAADILVTNHALLCIAALRNTSILHHGSDSRPLVAVVIDEADRLPDAARSVMTDQAPFMLIRRVAQKISGAISGNDAGAIIGAADNLIAVAADLENHYPKSEAVLIDDMAANDRKALRDAAIEFAGAVGQADGQIRKARDVPETHELAKDLLRYRDVLHKALIDEAETATVGVMQYSPTRKYPSVALARLYPARIIRWLLDYLRKGGIGDDEKEGVDVLQPFGTALVLTSATLSGASTNSGDRFWEMKIQFGIFDRENPCGHLHASFSPRRFGNIERVVLADPSVHKPFESTMDEDGEKDGEAVKVSEEWVNYTAQMLAAAAKEGGYVLALAGSYRVAGLLKMALDMIGGMNVVQKLRSEHIDSSIKRLLAKESGVFITPAGWEGLNARGYGFSWRSVALCQIPLSRTDSAHKAALVNYLMRKGKTGQEAEGIVYGETMSAAFRKMKQGVGRGIRSATDSFILWIADPRLPAFGSVTESDEPYPRPANRQLPQFSRCIPQRFRNTRTEILLKDGTMVS